MNNFEPLFLQDLVGEYFVSTIDSFDYGLETAVFPASKSAHKIVKPNNSYWVGIDFSNPIKKYIRHYLDYESAIEGHKNTISELKEAMNNDSAE